MSDREAGDDGGPAADFEIEALPHLDAVYRFAIRLAGSAGAAEDLVQDTFLRAYRSWDQYTPGTRCKSWLFTICRNVFLRGQERSTRHEQVLSESARGTADPVSRENPIFSSRESDPEADFFDSIVDEEVLAAIDGLSDEYRLVVVLSDLEGLSYAEIAETVGVPVGTVKSRLFRGRKHLQGQLRDFAVTMGYIPSHDPGG